MGRIDLMPLYRDRHGEPMLVCQWVMKFEDEQYRRVAVNKLLEGEEEVFVSTVWLGLCDSVFETMVFGGSQSGWQRNYLTEEEAQAGHQYAVETLMAGGSLDEV